MTADESAAQLNDDPAGEPVEVTVEARAHGWRLDHYLARLFPNYSRSLFHTAIEQGQVLVNGVTVKPSRKVRVNDRLSVRLPQQPDASLVPEDIPLTVLYEDDSLIVLDKAANMVVHPGRGNYRGTLAGALQFHFDQLSDTAGSLRPGIVHRLDRDTTGVLLVAKNNQVHHRLSGQFERREVEKEYRALAWGHVAFDSDYIDVHLRVHPKTREKMLVCEPGGNSRQAVTFFEVLRRYTTSTGARFTSVRLLPKTGRTHQLRVQLQFLGHPIVADRLYGGRSELKLSDVSQISAAEDRVLITRQALHAYRLKFRHPVTDQPMEFIAPLPEDFRATLDVLEPG